MKASAPKELTSVANKYSQLIDTNHVVLNSKGGVGKSCIAGILSEYFIATGVNTVCVDADPTVKTLSSYKSLKPVRIKNMIVKSEINDRALDEVFGFMSDTKGIVVLDTGGSGFVAFMNYMFQGSILEELRAVGKRTFYHVPIVAKQAQKESLSGLEYIVKNVPDFVEIVLWINEYNGELFEDGVPFMESTTYKSYEHRLAAVMRLPKLTEKTFGTDMSIMLENHMTFSDADKSEEFSMPAKIRLMKMRKLYHTSLDRVFGIDA